MKLVRKLIVTLGAMLAIVSYAQSPLPQDYKSAADIPVAQFFALADFREVRLSPDGKHMAAVAPLKGRGNLVVVDLDSRQARGLTGSDRWDVSGIRWIGNKRLYFTVSDGTEATGRARHKGAYSINLDGTDMREVWGDASGKMSGLRVGSVLGTVGGDSTQAFVTMRERTRDWLDAYKLDFRTLKFELLTFDSPGRVSKWVLDTQNRPRVAAREEKRPKDGMPQVTTVWLRGLDSGKWEQIFQTSSYRDGEEIELCGFDSDDRTLYVTARRGRDKAALWKYDTQTRQFGELMLEDNLVDIGCGERSLARDTTTKKVVGFSYDSTLPKTVFFDANSSYAKFAQQIASTLPGYANFRFSDDGKKALVSTVSDIDAGSYYLFDSTKNQLEAIAKSRPWFKPEYMAERRPILYTARDGLTIPAYLTLPRGVNPKNLPLIVNIHGGPMVRGYEWAEWGRWPEAQFFASRGYAVLEPEPRGSTGYGLQHFIKHFKQWGQAMQDDITDGALHLVKEGVVDKNRMCLHGGSYGGYATLQGLIREPNLFKCGHAFVAVTDLDLMQSIAYSDTATASDYFENEFKLWVGDINQDADMLHRYSPARNAEKIKGAVMLTMGSNDVRVPLVQGERMRDAMEKAGKTFEWKVYADEGHGFNRQANVTDFYTRTLRFYDEHLAQTR